VRVAEGERNWGGSRGRAHTRGGPACLGTYHLPHGRPEWQASLLKCALRTPVTLDDGSVIAFSRLNLLRAGLTHGQWRALSPAEKIERLLGLSLNQCCEVLSWPWEDCDPARLAIKVQVLCVVLTINFKELCDAGEFGPRVLNRALGRQRGPLRVRPLLWERSPW